MKFSLLALAVDGIDARESRASRDRCRGCFAATALLAFPLRPHSFFLGALSADEYH
jgi:hypothetical protein